MTDKKMRFVRLNYDAYIADNDMLYDTTDAEKAKEAGVFDEKARYEPMYYNAGSGRLFKILDEAILSAKKGEENTIEIAPEDGMGQRDPKLVQVISLKEFAKADIRPYPGLSVDFKGRKGIVEHVGSGRARVDFNSPLAGKNLKYVFTIVEDIEDEIEIVKAIFHSRLGSSEEFSFEMKDKVLSVKVADAMKYNQDWLYAKFVIVSELRAALDISAVEFVEVWETPAEKTEE